ncbi:poly(ADP-ribose) glycohydrolase 1 isoform X3 [Brachypodium distachyon]|uniref:poly(ADP-ribose) glycohydrolase 1 isoform X3 n=1 Tax=Brachypodium distachyon TaxID=15368 RepID=UPI000D0E113A|nr:poly(ADP-ribose) glycohydrolase 1 isoform X3 [Brachypodium distachyon]|eukprot:XP_024312390.1 poly(ADP-ribose) glycohydrolase 1 isoform X3 [Brachypodium distachyon]
MDYYIFQWKRGQRRAAMETEARSDLRSILPLLPVVLRGGALFWPPAAQEQLKALALGPDVSRVTSGDVLADALHDLRQALSLPALPARAAEGFALFFDDLLSRVHARGWFSDVLPRLARLLLRLPALLESHYGSASASGGGRALGLRLLGSQDAGLVLLGQELAAALLACALFCLFPTAGRSQARLPPINFDTLFASLTYNSRQSQEHKVRCLAHYFERVTESTPTGFVSFERKVLPLAHVSGGITYPDNDAWIKSSTPLCPFRVISSGLIEDEEQEALEVDFANKYLGGGALSRGCVQEEIRFMINPELIVGMLFMASMEDNEAIEIVGAERFSQYMGYGSSFRFVGDYLDTKPLDALGRRKTRILAIDALDCPTKLQYETSGLLREVNKALCGFLDQSKHQLYVKPFQDSNTKNNCPSVSSDECIGVSTGNWGCGAFGGNPEIKSMIQWIAASQACRPFVNYYTFEAASLRRLEEIDDGVV